MAVERGEAMISMKCVSDPIIFSVSIPQRWVHVQSLLIKKYSYSLWVTVALTAQDLSRIWTQRVVQGHHGSEITQWKILTAYSRIVALGLLSLPEDMLMQRRTLYMTSPHGLSFILFSCARTKANS